MPANLNALIRYKEIDLCLKNKYVDCTLPRLQEACTEALGEKRGVYKKVSKRTIQEDIRVMRSDILGFNAPIKIINGTYYYDLENYSIFNVPFSQEIILKDVLDILTEDNLYAKEERLENLVIRIATILGKNVSEYALKPEIKISAETAKALPSENKTKYEKPQISFKFSDNNPRRNEKVIKSGITWLNIFEIL